jgi:hypothetical protein
MVTGAYQKKGRGDLVPRHGDTLGHRDTDEHADQVYNRDLSLSLGSNVTDVVTILCERFVDSIARCR